MPWYVSPSGILLDMSLSKLQEIVEDREACHARVGHDLATEQHTHHRAFFLGLSMLFEVGVMPYKDVFCLFRLTMLWI